MVKEEVIEFFKTKIIATSETKKLKNKNKRYTYGTISIRDKRLSKHIGEEVGIKVLKLKKDEKK